MEFVHQGFISYCHNCLLPWKCWVLRQCVLEALLFPMEGTPLISPGLSPVYLTTWGGFPCFSNKTLSCGTLRDCVLLLKRLCCIVGPDSEDPARLALRVCLDKQQTLGARSRNAKWLPGISHSPWDLLDNEKPLNMGQIRVNLVWYSRDKGDWFEIAEG